MVELNERYVRQQWTLLSDDQVQKVLAVMQKYEPNRWWESEDKKVLAKWQLFEPILLCDFADYHEGIELLLCRPVWTHEFGLNEDGLKKEAGIAIQRMDSGASGSLTDAEREANIQAGIASIYRAGKPVIFVNSDNLGA